MLPQDILLHMINSTNYPKSQYYLRLIYKRIYNEHLPKRDVSEIKDIVKRKYNPIFKKIACDIDKFRIYKLDDGSFKISFNNNCYISDMFYDKHITEYSIIFSSLNYKEYVNLNKHITKLRCFVDCTRVYKSDNHNLFSYIDCDTFKELFPNIEELWIDINLLCDIDHDVFIGSIKKIIIEYDVSTDKDYKLICNVMKKKHPNIKYELYCLHEFVDVYQKKYNQMISSLNFTNLDDLRIHMDVYQLINIGEIDVIKKYVVTIFHQLYMLVYFEENLRKFFNKVIFIDYDNLESIILNTDLDLGIIRIINCPKLKYVYIKSEKYNVTVILENLPSLIYFDYHDNGMIIIKCVNTIIDRI